MQPLSEDEQSHVADVVRRAEVDEELDLLRIKYACVLSVMYGWITPSGIYTKSIICYVQIT